MNTQVQPQRGRSPGEIFTMRAPAKMFATKEIVDGLGKQKLIVDFNEGKGGGARPEVEPAEYSRRVNEYVTECTAKGVALDPTRFAQLRFIDPDATDKVELTIDEIANKFGDKVVTIKWPSAAIADRLEALKNHFVNIRRKLGEIHTDYEAKQITARQNNLAGQKSEGSPR